MPLFTSPDGRILFAMETAGEGDGNSVVYYDGVPVWDRFAWDAAHGIVTPPPPPPRQGLGIIEDATSTVIRPRLTRAEMVAFLPPAPGPFTFPAPYGTRGIRLTSERDGLVHPLGMSYWPNINQHAGRAELLVFLSVDDTLVLFSVEKRSGQVTRLTDPRLPHGTGEGTYWSVRNPHLLYLPQRNRLRAYDVVTGEAVDAVSVPDGEIRQCHSSADGRVHSMTLDGNPAVWVDGELRRFHCPHGYDECQIDKSGRYLLIKEKDRDGRWGNRIVDLHSRLEWFITDQQGAVGHSDMGFGYVLGEDDQTDPGGAFRLWIFTPNGPVDGGVIYATDWTSMSRYASHCGAQDVRGQPERFLFSGSVDGDHVRANELVVVEWQGTIAQRIRVVAPNMNDLTANDPHGADNRYWRKTRAQICPANEYAIVTGNCGTERVDAFLVEL